MGAGIEKPVIPSGVKRSRGIYAPIIFSAVEIVRRSFDALRLLRMTGVLLVM